MKHFLTLLDFTPIELNQLIQLGIEIKQNPPQPEFCNGKIMGMIFDKPSTRTRISFEAGMKQLGGDALFLSNTDTQLGRGEPIEDSARVISRMLDIVMIRTFKHSIIENFAKHSTVPVINGLTDSFHPCQLLADIMTFVEHRGSIAGKTVTWIGDGNNMCQSYINAATQFDFKLKIACPEGYEPDGKMIEANSNRVEITSIPRGAVEDSDLVVTDVWASMGQEKENNQRLQDFSNYSVDHELMSYAKNDALFMHCLPAHRGEEVSAELIEDKKISVVWDEAENRLHAQKALIQMLLNQ